MRTLFNGCHNHYIGNEDNFLLLVGMAAKIEVYPLTPFDPVSNPTLIDQRWKIWKRRFETYLVAVDIKEDKQKRALLLY